MAILGVDPKNPDRSAGKVNSRDSSWRKSGRSTPQYCRRKRRGCPMELESIPEPEGKTDQWSDAVDCPSGGEQPCLHRKEEPAVRHGGSPGTRGCFPKSRILQGSGNASFHIRQAAGHFV